MKVFCCDRCSNVIAFSALRCPHCTAELGYVDGERTKMTLGLQGESALGPVGALLISTMRSSFDKDNQTALRNFKALAEAG